MGLGSLLKAVVKTATLPIDIVQDVAEAGKNRRTEEAIEDIADELDDVI